jgi:integrase
MKVWPSLIVAFVQDRLGHASTQNTIVAFVQDRLGHANTQNTMVVYVFYPTATRDA